MWSRRTRLVVTVVLAVLLIGYVAASVQASSRRRAEVREITGTRLLLTGGGAVPPQRGQAGAEVQAAHVAVTVRNTGTVPLRVLATSLDGTADGVDLQLPIDGQRDVPVTWQVRCAEVGTLPGPRVLDVIVRGPLHRHVVRLDVPEYDASPLRQLFHRAAVQSCDVLTAAGR